MNKLLEEIGQVLGFYVKPRSKEEAKLDLERRCEAFFGPGAKAELGADNVLKITWWRVE